MVRKGKKGKNGLDGDGKSRMIHTKFVLSEAEINILTEIANNQTVNPKSNKHELKNKIDVSHMINDYHQEEKSNAVEQFSEYQKKTEFFITNQLTPLFEKITSSDIKTIASSPCIVQLNSGNQSQASSLDNSKYGSLSSSPTEREEKEKPIDIHIEGVVPTCEDISSTTGTNLHENKEKGQHSHSTKNQATDNAIFGPDTSAYDEIVETLCEKMTKGVWSTYKSGMKLDLLKHYYHYPSGFHNEGIWHNCIMALNYYMLMYIHAQKTEEKKRRKVSISYVDIQRQKRLEKSKAIHRNELSGDDIDLVYKKRRGFETRSLSFARKDPLLTSTTESDEDDPLKSPTKLGKKESIFRKIGRRPTEIFNWKSASRRHYSDGVPFQTESEINGLKKKVFQKRNPYIEPLQRLLVNLFELNFDLKDKMFYSRRHSSFWNHPDCIETPRVMKQRPAFDDGTSLRKKKLQKDESHSTGLLQNEEIDTNDHLDENTKDEDIKSVVVDLNDIDSNILLNDIVSDKDESSESEIQKVESEPLNEEQEECSHEKLEDEVLIEDIEDDEDSIKDDESSETKEDSTEEQNKTKKQEYEKFKSFRETNDEKRLIVNAIAVLCFSVCIHLDPLNDGICKTGKEWKEWIDRYKLKEKFNVQEWFQTIHNNFYDDKTKLYASHIELDKSCDTFKLDEDNYRVEDETLPRKYKLIPKYRAVDHSVMLLAAIQVSKLEARHKSISTVIHLRNCLLNVFGYKNTRLNKILNEEVQEKSHIGRQENKPVTNKPEDESIKKDHLEGSSKNENPDAQDKDNEQTNDLANKIDDIQKNKSIIYESPIPIAKALYSEKIRNYIILDEHKNVIPCKDQSRYLWHEDWILFGLLSSNPMFQRDSIIKAFSLKEYLDESPLQMEESLANDMYNTFRDIEQNKHNGLWNKSKQEEEEQEDNRCIATNSNSIYYMLIYNMMLKRYLTKKKIKRKERREEEEFFKYNSDEYYQECLLKYGTFLKEMVIEKFKIQGSTTYKDDAIWASSETIFSLILTCNEASFDKHKKKESQLNEKKDEENDLNDNFPTSFFEHFTLGS